MTTFDKLRDMIIEEGYADNVLRSRLIVDLDIDSLERAELMLRIEETLGIEIPEDDFQKFCSIQDICDYADKVAA